MELVLNVTLMSAEPEVAEIAPLVYPDPRDFTVLNYLRFLPPTCYSLPWSPTAHQYAVYDWFYGVNLMREAGNEAQVLDLIAQTKAYGATQPDDREVYLAESFRLDHIPRNAWGQPWRTAGWRSLRVN